MKDWIHEFEKPYTRITLTGIALSPANTTFKILNSSRKDARDHKTVLKGVDY